MSIRIFKICVNKLHAKKINILRIIFNILILSSFILLHASCNNPEEPPPKDSVEVAISNGILPLKVGYYWKYQNYYLKADTSISGEGRTEEYKINKLSTTIYSNENYSVFHRIWGYFNTSMGHYIYAADEWFFRNFNDGLYQMGGKVNDDSIYTKLLWYKYPVQKGETWESPDLVYNTLTNNFFINDSTTYTCTDSNVVFKTPLGNFSCIVYYHREIDNEGDVISITDIYDYYLPNLGLVGEITYGYDKYSQRSWPIMKKVLIETNVNLN